MKSRNTPELDSSKFSLWGWVPKTVEALAAAIERICLIPESVRSARLARRAKQLHMALRLTQMTGLAPEQALRLVEDEKRGLEVFEGSHARMAPRVPSLPEKRH